MGIEQVYVHVSTIEHKCSITSNVIDGRVLAPTAPVCWLGAPDVSGSDRPASFF